MDAFFRLGHIELDISQSRTQRAERYRDDVFFDLVFYCAVGTSVLQVAPLITPSLPFDV